MQNLQRIVACAQEDEDEFVRMVREEKTAMRFAEQEQAKRRLEKQVLRINELDAIIRRLYEDHVMGKLTAERFTKLSEGYGKEQAELAASVEELRTVIEEDEAQAVNIESLIKIVKKYTEPEKLTPMMLRELVEKIVVHVPWDSEQVWTYFDMIWEIVGKTE